MISSLLSIGQKLTETSLISVVGLENSECNFNINLYTKGGVAKMGPNDARNIISYLRAGYPCFLVKTTESDRAEKVLKGILEEGKWTSAKGQEKRTEYQINHWDALTSPAQSPIETLTDMEPNSIIFLQNYHWYIKERNIIQMIQNNVEKWRNKGKAIIILAPVDSLPVEIRKEFMVMRLPLPEAEEISLSLEHVAESAKDDSLANPENKDEIIQACRGLTKTEIENALSRSAITNGYFDPIIINEQKIQTIEKSGLRVMRPEKTYADLIGYEKAKWVVGKMISKRSSKGCLFAGPPGCGKTSFMEATVGEFNKLGIYINFGRMFSKWQGEGDARVEEVIDILCAVGDCVVVIDEFEKQFAVAGSSGEGDGGTGKRMAGEWLKFMEKRPEGIYLMGTANSFSGIPDEYRRIGRWDSNPFYIDMPNDAEKEAILSYYIKKLELKTTKDELESLSMKDWTGSEIEGCCRMAKNLECTLPEATKFIVPQNKGGFLEAKALKEFCINASEISTDVPIERPRQLNM